MDFLGGYQDRSIGDMGDVVICSIAGHVSPMIKSILSNLCRAVHTVLILFYFCLVS